MGYTPDNPTGPEALCRPNTAPFHAELTTCFIQPHTDAQIAATGPSIDPLSAIVVAVSLILVGTLAWLGRRHDQGHA